MSSLKWILLTLCVMQVGVPVFAQVQDCPRYCSCAPTVNGVSVNCNYQRLTSMEGMVFPANTFYLDFSFNTLSEINRDAIPNLPNLMILKIEECQVSSIAADSFAHLPNLQNLTLNGNQIQDIHKDAFRGLRSLRHLFLENNKIVNLEDGVFDSLELEQLYLTGNGIQRLTSGTFNGLMVSEIRLGENELSTLTSEMLEPVKERLNVLILDDNKVPLEIDINTFENMYLHILGLSNSMITEHGFLKNVETETLDISRNTFTSLDFSPYTSLARVKKLNLAELGIEFLDESTLSPFQGVTKLDLSENKMTVVSGSVWQKVPNLHELNLMANPIAQLSNSFGRYLSNLNTLGLRGCKLTELTPEPFNPMVNLRTLDVGGNSIQVIGPQMEQVLNRLSSVVVDSNPFHCNCEILWFYDWVRQNHQQMNFVVQGFDYCTVPGVGRIYIWGHQREEMVCMPPTISHIIGSTELGAHASGNGEAMDVAAGTTIMLQCSAQGDPAPMIKWNFPFATPDEVVIEPNTNRSVVRTNSHYQLKDIRLDQSGQYKCIASNMQDTTEAYIQINVRADMTLPYTPGPPTRSTAPTPTQKSTTSGNVPGKPTAPGTDDSSEEPTSGNQVKADNGGSDDKVKYTVIGVGVAVILLTLIVLIVVIVYVYKARQRAYQRTYAVGHRNGDVKYPAVDDMTNGEMANGHTQLSRLDSEVSTKSTTPFGLSHA